MDLGLKIEDRNEVNIIDNLVFYLEIVWSSWFEIGERIKHKTKIVEGGRIKKEGTIKIIERIGIT